MMKLHRCGLALLVCICAAQQISFQQPDQQQLMLSQNPHLRLHGDVIEASMWRHFDPLPVCWENPSDSYRAQMQLVQRAVTESWQAHSQLNFTGWQKCAKKNHGIRIFIADVGPNTQKVGQFVDGIRNGVTLNFDFETWGTTCLDTRDACIRSIAVHEFGHAIGFVHEQNNPKSPGECLAKAQGPDADRFLTPYDPNSVMNYCNPQYNNGGQLSILDIQAVQAIYGPPRRGA
jgi:hypothetical protein